MELKNGRQKLKCLLIGDEGIGKSAVVQRFRTDEFSKVYIPTIWNNFSVKKCGTGGGAAEENICLDICDTGGQIEFDRFRPLCYADVDVFIICFSVVSPSSFQSVMTKWLPEIKRHSSGTASNSDRIILLVGTKSDLRSNTNVLLKLSEEGTCAVSESQAMKLAKKIGAKSYIECSSLVGKNVKQVFDYALSWGLNLNTPSTETSASGSGSGPASPATTSPGTGVGIGRLTRGGNGNNSTSDIGMTKTMRGASGHFSRWKSYNQQKRKQQHSAASTRLKRFILMFAFFK